ncbi:hypothetical protein GCM10009528_06420 [Kineococcus aurantiacus]
MYTVVTGILVERSRVLLTLRSPRREAHPGTWALPGGQVEPGEQETDALRRELREELGIDALDCDEEPTGRLQLLDGPPGTHLHLSIWRVRTWTGRPGNRQPEEHERTAWFDATDLDDLTWAHPGHRQGLQHLLTHPGTDPPGHRVSRALAGDQRRDLGHPRLHTSGQPPTKPPRAASPRPCPARCHRCRRCRSTRCPSSAGLAPTRVTRWVRTGRAVAAATTGRRGRRPRSGAVSRRPLGETSPPVPCWPSPGGPPSPRRPPPHGARGGVEQEVVTGCRTSPPQRPASPTPAAPDAGSC